MTKTCTILIGLPGSGKSTYSDFLDVYNTFVLSTDNVIERISNEYGFTYSEGFTHLIQFAEKVYYSDFLHAIETHSNIVIDRTNLTVKGRRKIFDILKGHGYIIKALVFKTPEQDEWDRRLESRIGKHIPKEVLESMQKNYQKPTFQEGFDEIEYYNEI